MVDFITDHIDYKSVLVDSNLKAYTDTDCIIEGGEFEFKLKEDNRTIEVTINPGKYILQHTLLVLVNIYKLSINLEPYDDSGLVVVLAHYTPCNIKCGNNFQYRIGFVSSDNEVLEPMYSLDSDVDIIKNSHTILLGVIKFKKNNNKIIDIYDITPNRDIIWSYINNPSYDILHRLFEVIPFDRITDRICKLVAGQTGGIGVQGPIGPTGLEGPIGPTGNTGGTGEIGHIGFPGAGHQYTHLQQEPSKIWYVEHNMNMKYPMIQIYKLCATENIIINPVSINFINSNYLVLYFTEEICGRAILLTGHSYNINHDKELNKLPSINNIDFPCIFTGKQGSMGDIGPTGPTGDIGPTGPTGWSGLNGRDGSDGCRGERGEVGAKGDRGTVGPRGPTGPTGPIGQPGNIGYGINTEYINIDKTLGFIKFNTGFKMQWTINPNGKMEVEYSLEK